MYQSETMQKDKPTQATRFERQRFPENKRAVKANTKTLHPRSSSKSASLPRSSLTPSSSSWSWSTHSLYPNSPPYLIPEPDTQLTPLPGKQPTQQGPRFTGLPDKRLDSSLQSSCSFDPEPNLSIRYC